MARLGSGKGVSSLAVGTASAFASDAGGRGGSASAGSGGEAGGCTAEVARGLRTAGGGTGGLMAMSPVVGGAGAGPGSSTHSMRCTVGWGGEMGRAGARG